jgi:hypothetical protein
MWLSAASWGGGPGTAPAFDADPTKEYVDGSSGIAVLSAVDRSLLASMPMANHGNFGVDSLDLSAFAGQQVVFQVVDAFQGGWGWLAVDKIQISTEVIKLPTLGLIAQWKLDETSGTAVADELGNSDGTLVGGADSMWVAGWDGNALAFSDSAHVLVEANDVIEMDSTESFTISMLVKADPITNTGGTHLIHKGDFGKWYAMECKDGQVRIAVDDAVTKTQLGVDITSIWPTNRWAHLVGVRDIGADVLRLYLNGELIGEMEDGTEGDIASPDLPLSIGNYWGSTSNALMEQLDDVRIYNYALTDGAVEDLFDGYGIATDVEEERGTMPLTYDLKQNYPNPFNPTTNIQFQIPKDGHVTISVYNSLGQRVATLVDRNLKSGRHHVTFDAAKYSSGIYFYRIKAEGFSQVKKMMLIK